MHLGYKLGVLLAFFKGRRWGWVTLCITFQCSCDPWVPLWLVHFIDCHGWLWWSSFLKLLQEFFEMQNKRRLRTTVVLDPCLSGLNIIFFSSSPAGWHHLALSKSEGSSLQGWILNDNAPKTECWFGFLKSRDTSPESFVPSYPFMPDLRHATKSLRFLLQEQDFGGLQHLFQHLKN